MARAEGIAHPLVATLLLELAAVIIAETRPQTLAREVLLFQNPAGVLERNAAVDLLLRERRELRAEWADARAFRPHQDTSFLQPPAARDFQRSQADLDNVVR